MTKKNPAAVALGKLGGRVRSDAKTSAARQNGKKGGRPKGRTRRPRDTGGVTEQEMDALNAAIDRNEWAYERHGGLNSDLVLADLAVMRRALKRLLRP
jgi:hypothetical protein